jgi:anti-sigma regulatory factor (Ser/Thr protein kinase)
MTGFGEMPNYKFAADWPGLMSAEKWVAQSCAALAIPEEAVYAIQVCFEELASNIVRHAADGAAGAGLDAATWVKVSLGTDDTSAALRIEDDGLAFDPTVKRPDAEQPDTFRVGGLGLGLIHSMSSSLAYSRVNGVNSTTVFIPLRADAAAQG